MVKLHWGTSVALAWTGKNPESTPACVHGAANVDWVTVYKKRRKPSLEFNPEPLSCSTYVVLGHAKKHTLISLRLWEEKNDSQLESDGVANARVDRGWRIGEAVCADHDIHRRGGGNGKGRSGNSGREELHLGFFKRRIRSIDLKERPNSLRDGNNK